jgi:hypothetical protein
MGAGTAGTSTAGLRKKNRILYVCRQGFPRSPQSLQIRDQKLSAGTETPGIGPD